MISYFCKMARFPFRYTWINYFGLSFVVPNYFDCYTVIPIQVEINIFDYASRESKKKNKKNNCYIEMLFEIFALVCNTTAFYRDRN